LCVKAELFNLKLIKLNLKLIQSVLQLQLKHEQAHLRAAKLTFNVTKLVSVRQPDGLIAGLSFKDQV